jgi:hypothetical protein
MHPCLQLSLFSCVGGVSISECRREIFFFGGGGSDPMDTSDYVGFVSGIFCFFCVLQIVARFGCLKFFI